MKTIATSAAALAAQTALGEAIPPSQYPEREYYEIRKYHLQNGQQTKLTQSYFADALIPALNKLGLSPIGAFSLDIGPETPTYYLLIPSASLDALANAELRLAADPAFLKAAAPFWSAPATNPSFLRIESSLYSAFTGRPKLRLPPPSAMQGKRMFQLRTYESPSPAAHVRKVEMFNNGEYEIFERAGFWPIFYGDALIGSHLPQLTYMLSFTDLADMAAKWASFQNDPAWKKLSADPHYAYEPIVSSITNLVLSPLACSQI